MGDRSRRKGLRGEAEVADRLRAAGYEVRGLEAAGDWLCIRVDGAPLAFEVKRAERLKLPEWTRQAEADAPPGSVPLLAYRQSREPWRVTLRLEDLLELIG